MPKRFSTARGREFGDAVRTAVSATGMTASEICEKIDCGFRQAAALRS
ncbi:hypothetical protein [Lentzea nigeriaca]|nr:hypothetical protein [Lentzea nigeriaca]MBM7859271.1 hypothetical protein [Lentzea nigeriaca]